MAYSHSLVYIYFVFLSIISNFVRLFSTFNTSDFEYIAVKGFNPTLGHIAGLKNNPRIKATVGTGISEYSQLLAKDIVTYQDRIANKERDLKEILELEQFKGFCQVFDQFLFGAVTQSLLLLHCYPIERFLVNGKRYFRGNHDISLRKFQAYLGSAEKVCWWGQGVGCGVWGVGFYRF